MPHGYPDYGVSAPKRTVYALQDMAELAARLGSIVTFDRRGDVILIDDFEPALLKWASGGDPVNWSVAFNTDYARSGKQCIKLTTAAGVDSWVSIEKYLTYPVRSRIGFEISFTISDDIGYHRLRILLAEGNKEYGAYARFVFNDQILQILDENDNWVTVATDVYTAARSGQFHTMKLVADFTTHYYTRLIFLDRTIDLSAYPLRSYPISPERELRAELLITSDITGSAITYADDAIITQNEP